MKLISQKFTCLVIRNAQYTLILTAFLPGHSIDESFEFVPSQREFFKTFLSEKCGLEPFLRKNRYEQVNLSKFFYRFSNNFLINCLQVRSVFDN